MSFYGCRRIPGRLTLNLYNAGIAALTVGSIMKGEKVNHNRFKNWSVIKNGPVKMRYLTATASTTTSTSTAASTISKITLTPTSALPAVTPTSTTTAPEHKNILLSYSYGEFPPSL